MNVSIRRAIASDHAALVRFFEAADSRCFCHYHDFPGDGRDWQRSLAADSVSHAKALGEGLGSGELTALIAVRGDQIVGWMRFGAPSRNRQYGQRVYRDLPCLSGSRERVASVYCLLVAPELRRTGIARGLVRELVGEGRALGFEEIEGLPRGGEGVRDEELWTGPLRLFEDLGFAVVSDFPPYPIVRRSAEPVEPKDDTRTVESR